MAQSEKVLKAELALDVARANTVKAFDLIATLQREIQKAPKFSLLKGQKIAALEAARESAYNIHNAELRAIAFLDEANDLELAA